MVTIRNIDRSDDEDSHQLMARFVELIQVTNSLLDVEGEQLVSI